MISTEIEKSFRKLINRTAGATVARSTPDRKVIRSNRVWFNTSFIDHLYFLPAFTPTILMIRLFSSFDIGFWDG